jgi:hypothetical protein
MNHNDLSAIAKDAAERVAKNAGVPAQLCYAPILWALEDAADAEQPQKHEWQWDDYFFVFFAVLVIGGAALVAILR